MCIPDNSIDLVTTICAMCKVFKPTGPRCPHKRQTCRNRDNHPRHDVVHFINAEVQSFNGCGFCKWATQSTLPPASKLGMHNPGWPGCCRPPLASEYVMIQPADWPAVSIVHRVPIPADIKAILDAAVKALASAGAMPGSLRVATPTERKPLRAIGRVNSSTNAGAIANGASPTSTTAMAIPQKKRSGGSPQMKPASLSSSAPRQPLGTGAAQAQPSSVGDRPARRERQASPDVPLKRIEGFRTTPPASVRRLVDTDGAHPPVSRPSLTAAALSPTSPTTPVSGTQTPQRQRSLKRRGSTSSSRFESTPKQSLNASSPKTPAAKPKAESQNTSLEDGLKALSVTSDSSSESGSRGSSKGSSVNGASTVTSDGGFTDYLSDESEAELQRQAEVRAALLEQHRAEEQEFRAARQQLAAIDLRPPQAWSTGETVG